MLVTDAITKVIHGSQFVVISCTVVHCFSTYLLSFLQLVALCCKTINSNFTQFQTLIAPFQSIILGSQYAEYLETPLPICQAFDVDLIPHGTWVTGYFWHYEVVLASSYSSKLE